MSEDSTIDKQTIELPADDHEPLSRRQVIGLIERGMAETVRKIESGYVRDAEKEDMRIGRMNSLVRLAKEHRLARKDLDLDEMQEQLDEIGVVDD
jgi:hypothetical protein